MSPKRWRGGMKGATGNAMEGASILIEAARRTLSFSGAGLPEGPTRFTWPQAKAWLQTAINTSKINFCTFIGSPPIRQGYGHAFDEKKRISDAHKPVKGGRRRGKGKGSAKFKFFLSVRITSPRFQESW
jgi:hypothetical protein